MRFDDWYTTGCILGSGRFNNFRSYSQIPVAGVVTMTIDSEDLSFLKANPDVFNDVMTHELGHALGIGTLWGNAVVGLPFH